MTFQQIQSPTRAYLQNFRHYTRASESEQDSITNCTRTYRWRHLSTYIHICIFIPRSSLEVPLHVPIYILTEL